MHVCVLGGGVVGVTTAYYLARDGHKVTVIEGRESAGLETSFANGGQLSYSYVAPLADPGVLPKLSGWLLDPEAALRFVPRLDPQQWMWCLSFLNACRSSTARQVTAELLELGYYSRGLMGSLTRQEAIDFDHVRNGKLVVYRSPEDFEGAKRQMAFQAKHGSEQEALDPAACLAVEPALANIAPHLAGGIFTPSEEAGDCHKFTANLARIAREKFKVAFMTGTRVQSLRTERGRIVAARTDRGEVAADAFVVALGTGSRELLSPLGLPLPIYPLTGYSLTLPIEQQHQAPRVSITDAHHKIVYAALGDRLRIAGMVDLVGQNARPNPKRLALLARQARETFPLAGDFDRAQAWTGHRPATPNSKPILGPTAYSNLWLNTGHGGLGFTLACGSARIVADCVLRRRPAVDLSAFAFGDVPEETTVRPAPRPATATAQKAA